MEYQYKIKDGCLIIENTRYRRYFLTIVILSTIGGAIVLIIIAIIIYKVCKKRPSYITNIPLENYERPPTPYPADLDIGNNIKDDEYNYNIETPYYKFNEKNKKNNAIYNISFIPLVIYQMVERSIR